MTSFICGIQKEIIQMNLQNTKRLTDLEDNLWLPIHTVFKMDHQHGPTVQHKERCSMLCGSLNRRVSFRKNGFMYTYGWVPSLFTWNYHNVVNRLHSNTKKQVRKIHKITLLPCTHDHSTTPHALMEFI